MKQPQIWNVDTAIEDFTEDPNDLTSSEVLGIKASWEKQLHQFKENQESIDEFTERLGREWAIENLYTIDRGVTTTLIEYGFKADISIMGRINLGSTF